MSDETKFIKHYIEICKLYGLYIPGYGCLEKLQDNEKIDYEVFNNGFGKQVMYYGIKELSKKQIQKMLYNVTKEKALIRQKRYRDKKKNTI